MFKDHSCQLDNVTPTEDLLSNFGLNPNKGATLAIISALTGTAVQPAVRFGSGPEVSWASSKVTTSTYSGSCTGKIDAKLVIFFSLS